MALSVPYHPYSCCLICGDDGIRYDEELTKTQKDLQRCSSCRQAIYCSRNCQRQDWRVHKRECGLLQDENSIALALSATDPRFLTITDGRSLRNQLVANISPTEPFKFVLRELSNFLHLSTKHWDPHGSSNGLIVIDRMNLAMEEAQVYHSSVDWVHLSSILFGTLMVHNVVEQQAEPENKFGNNAWFQAFIVNFGEVLDRIKLFAILQENDYGHFLPDCEFPLIQMKEPILVGGKFFFPFGRTVIPKGKRCMVCHDNFSQSTAISSHDPNRTKSEELRYVPREVNFLPPRPNYQFLNDPQVNEKTTQRLKTWLHIVARTKRIPKEFVCSDDCEQHALYGRMFEAHPLERLTKDRSDDSDESDEDNDNDDDRHDDNAIDKDKGKGVKD